MAAEIFVIESTEGAGIEVCAIIHMSQQMVKNGACGAPKEFLKRWFFSAHDGIICTIEIPERLYFSYTFFR
jgi:hypothetical protein